MSLKQWGIVADVVFRKLDGKMSQEIRERWRKIHRVVSFFFFFFLILISSIQLLSQDDPTQRSRFTLLVANIVDDHPENRLDSIWISFDTSRHG